MSAYISQTMRNHSNKIKDKIFRYEDPWRVAPCQRTLQKCVRLRHGGWIQLSSIFLEPKFQGLINISYLCFGTILEVHSKDNFLHWYSWYFRWNNLYLELDILYPNKFSRISFSIFGWILSIFLVLFILTAPVNVFFPG